MSDESFVTTMRNKFSSPEKGTLLGKASECEELAMEYIRTIKSAGNNSSFYLDLDKLCGNETPSEAQELVAERLITKGVAYKWCYNNGGNKRCYFKK